MGSPSASDGARRGKRGHRDGSLTPVHRGGKRREGSPFGTRKARNHTSSGDIKGRGAPGVPRKKNDSTGDKIGNVVSRSQSPGARRGNPARADGRAKDKVAEEAADDLVAVGEAATAGVANEASLLPASKSELPVAKVDIRSGQLALASAQPVVTSPPVAPAAVVPAVVPAVAPLQHSGTPTGSGGALPPSHPGSATTSVNFVGSATGGRGSGAGLSKITLGGDGTAFSGSAGWGPSTTGGRRMSGGLGGASPASSSESVGAAPRGIVQTGSQPGGHSGPYPGAQSAIAPITPVTPMGVNMADFAVQQRTNGELPRRQMRGLARAESTGEAMGGEGLGHVAGVVGSDAGQMDSPALDRRAVYAQGRASSVGSISALVGRRLGKLASAAPSPMTLDASHSNSVGSAALGWTGGQFNTFVQPMPMTGDVEAHAMGPDEWGGSPVVSGSVTPGAIMQRLDIARDGPFDSDASGAHSVFAATATGSVMIKRQGAASISSSMNYTNGEVLAAVTQGMSPLTSPRKLAIEVPPSPGMPALEPLQHASSGGKLESGSLTQRGLGSILKRDGVYKSLGMIALNTTTAKGRRRHRFVVDANGQPVPVGGAVLRTGMMRLGSCPVDVCGVGAKKHLGIHRLAWYKLRRLVAGIWHSIVVPAEDIDVDLPGEHLDTTRPVLTGTSPRPGAGQGYGTPRGTGTPRLAGTLEADCTTSGSSLSDTTGTNFEQLLLAVNADPSKRSIDSTNDSFDDDDSGFTSPVAKPGLWKQLLSVTKLAGSSNHVTPGPGVVQGRQPGSRPSLVRRITNGDLAQKVVPPRLRKELSKVMVTARNSLESVLTEQGAMAVLTSENDRFAGLTPIQRECREAEERHVMMERLDYLMRRAVRRSNVGQETASAMLRHTRRWVDRVAITTRQEVAKRGRSERRRMSTLVEHTGVHGSSLGSLPGTPLATTGTMERIEKSALAASSDLEEDNDDSNDGDSGTGKTKRSVVGSWLDGSGLAEFTGQSSRRRAAIGVRMQLSGTSRPRRDDAKGVETKAMARVKSKRKRSSFLALGGLLTAPKSVVTIRGLTPRAQSNDSKTADHFDSKGVEIVAGTSKVLSRVPEREEYSDDMSYALGSGGGRRRRRNGGGRRGRRDRDRDRDRRRRRRRRR